MKNEINRAVEFIFGCSHEYKFDDTFDLHNPFTGEFVERFYNYRCSKCSNVSQRRDPPGKN